jgi:hypothetical protein
MKRHHSGGGEKSQNLDVNEHAPPSRPEGHEMRTDEA